MDGAVVPAKIAEEEVMQANEGKKDVSSGGHRSVNTHRIVVSSAPAAPQPGTPAYVINQSPRRVRIRLEEHNPSPRASGTVVRKMRPAWIKTPEDAAYFQKVCCLLDEIWVGKHSTKQVNVVECCYDTEYDDFVLRERDAVLACLEHWRIVGEAQVVTRDELAARMRRKGEDEYGLFAYVMKLLVKARRSFYIAREAVEVVPQCPALFKPLYDAINPSPQRSLVIYTLVCNPMETRLRQHLGRLARLSRQLRDASPASPASSPRLEDEEEPSTSMDEIDLSDGDF